MGWNVLVVDDEPNMQEVTALVLSRMSFEGMPLNLHYASSAQAAIEALSRIPDVSVVLLDVVMEHDSSGLELISHVRNEMKNPFMRFILRTGQAGAAPESVVIQNYDIQEYLNKADLTVKRLRNAVTTALRSYVALARMERRRQISDLILQQSQKLQDDAIDEEQFLDLIATGIIDVFSNSPCAAPRHKDVGDRFSYLILRGADTKDADSAIVEAVGDHERWKGARPSDVADPDIREALLASMDSDERVSITEKGDLLQLLLSFREPGVAPAALLLSAPAERVDAGYLRTLANHAQSIFERKAAHWRMRRSYAETARQLAGIVELRLGGDDGRMDQISRQVRLLALSAGCDDRRAQLLGRAAALHDTGKIRIPDAILMKPGKLTPEEWTLMSGHPAHGHDMLAASPVEELQLGAIIALEHHERWDGAGYPAALAGDAISLGARITAIIDVHDRLMSDRPYRKALSQAEAADYLRQNAGSHFDPALVRNFFEIYDAVMAVRAAALPAAL